jgi:hypothetical protein
LAFSFYADTQYHPHCPVLLGNKLLHVKTTYMKVIVIGCLAGITLLTATCKKHDYCPEPPKQDNTCELMQTYLLIDYPPENGGGLFSEYRKEVDATGKVRKVVAGLHTLGLYDSVSMLLQYHGNTIYFIDENIPDDTLTIATFDTHNRLRQMVPGTITTFRHPFPATQFLYEGNRLSRYLIDDLFDYRLAYDAYGNVSRIYLQADSTDRGLFFTYDHRVTAKRQFYSDPFKLNGVSDAVNLAQFLGWLPELEPENKLIYYKLVTFEPQTLDDEPYVYDYFLTGHVYDSKGNLLRYNVGAYQYSNNYSCTEQKN